jgi:hypothetical protein
MRARRFLGWWVAWLLKTLHPMLKTLHPMLKVPLGR